MSNTTTDLNVVFAWKLKFNLHVEASVCSPRLLNKISVHTPSRLTNHYVPLKLPLCHTHYQLPNPLRFCFVRSIMRIIASLIKPSILLIRYKSLFYERGWLSCLLSCIAYTFAYVQKLIVFSLLNVRGYRVVLRRYVCKFINLDIRLLGLDMCIILCNIIY